MLLVGAGTQWEVVLVGGQPVGDDEGRGVGRCDRDREFGQGGAGSVEGEAAAASHPAQNFRTRLRPAFVIFRGSFLIVVLLVCDSHGN